MIKAIKNFCRPDRYPLSQDDLQWIERTGEQAKAMQHLSPEDAREIQQRVKRISFENERRLYWVNRMQGYNQGIFHAATINILAMSLWFFADAPPNTIMTGVAIGLIILSLCTPRFVK